MKRSVLVAGLCISVALVASARVSAETTPAETKYMTVDGEVVRYEAGRVIVIRGADNKEVVYTLSPSIVVPADVKIGRQVTLFTEPAKEGGTQLVSRVTTTSVTPDGAVKRTTEDTRHLPSGATTRTTTTTISGQVAAYEPGKTLTITRFDGSKVTYVINEEVTTLPRPGHRQDRLHPSAGHHRPGRARRANHHVRHHHQERELSPDHDAVQYLGEPRAVGPGLIPDPRIDSSHRLSSLSRRASATAAVSCPTAFQCESCGKCTL